MGVKISIDAQRRSIVSRALARSMSSQREKHGHFEAI